MGSLDKKQETDLLLFCKSDIFPHRDGSGPPRITHQEKEKTMGKGDNSKKDDKKSKKPKQDKKVVKPDAKK